MRRLLLLFFLCMPSSVQAISLYQDERTAIDLKGYYKNLVFSTKRATTGSEVIAELNRIRTEWDASFFKKLLSAKVIWDNELIGGDYVNTEEFGARQTARNDPYLDLDYELVRQDSFFYGQSLYRAYARLDPGPFQLTVGRQKIDWGAMRLFSPADLFTRLPIFDVEKEERVGTTGAVFEIPIGSSFRIQSVYAINPDFDRSRIAGRVTKTVGRFDLSISGGKFLQDEVFGLEVSGDVKQAGVRGELVYDRAEFGDDFVQGAVGIDYGFENTFYFAVEYFFNGQGTNSAATITPFPATGNPIKSVHQNFAGLQLRYDLTPLWNASLENVVDLNGGSVFISPETRYSLFEWFEVTVGGQFPVGKAGGEFTAVPNVYYAETQFFF